MQPLTFLGEFVNVKKLLSECKHNYSLIISLEDKSNISVVDFTPKTFAESFVLDFQIKWPMNLVINEMVRNNTKLLFRHIFQCIITEYKLSSIWALTNSIRGSLSKYSSFFLPALILGENMINFNNQYLMFIHVFVIEPAFHDLNNKLKNAKTLEDVITYVEECISTCCNESLMRKYHLIGALANINELCSDFGDFINTLLVAFDENLAEVVQDPQNPPTQQDVISTLTSINENQLQTLQLNSHHHQLRKASSISSLVSLNTNTYHIGVPAKMSAHQIFPPSLSHKEKRNLVELKRKVMEKTIDYYADLPEFHATVATFSSRFIVLVNELLGDLNQAYGKHCARLKTLANLIDAKGFYAEASRKVFEEQTEAAGSTSQQSDTMIEPGHKNNIFQSSFVKHPDSSVVLVNQLLPATTVLPSSSSDKVLENVSEWLSHSRMTGQPTNLTSDEFDQQNAA